MRRPSRGRQPHDRRRSPSPHLPRAACRRVVDHALRYKRVVVVSVSIPHAAVDSVVRREARSAASATRAGFVSLSALDEHAMTAARRRRRASCPIPRFCRETTRADRRAVLRDRRRDDRAGHRAEAPMSEPAFAEQPARELYVRHARMDGRSVVRLRAMDEGDRCVVEARSGRPHPQSTPFRRARTRSRPRSRRHASSRTQWRRSSRSAATSPRPEAGTRGPVGATPAAAQRPPQRLRAVGVGR